jgi:hypothetical protein
MDAEEGRQRAFNNSWVFGSMLPDDPGAFDGAFTKLMDTHCCSRSRCTKNDEATGQFADQAEAARRLLRKAVTF